MRFLRVNGDKASQTFRALPIVNPLVELLEFLLFLLNVLAKLYSFFCALLLFEFSSLLFRRLPSQCDGGSHESGDKIADHALDSLNFGIAPSRPLFVFSPCTCVDK